MQEEIWKDIYFIENGIEYDYRGLYQVSNKGNVKSLSRLNSCGYLIKEKILKSVKRKDGYLCVVLCKNAERKGFRVHRLVAHMFIDGYFEGADIDHINTIRTDNRSENLHWCNRKENCNNELTRKNNSKAKKGENHPNLGSLIERWSKDGELMDTKYQFEFVQMGFNSSDISKCCKGKCKSVGRGKGTEKFIFRYHKNLD